VVVRNTGGPFYPVLVDDVAAYRTAHELSAVNPLNYTIPGGAPVNQWYPVRFLASTLYPFTINYRYDWGNVGFGHATPNAYDNSSIQLTGVLVGAARGCGYYVREDGTYQIHANVAVTSGSPASGQYTTARIVKNATYHNPNGYNIGGTPLLQVQVAELQATAQFGNPALGGNRAMIFHLTTRAVLARGDLVQVEWFRTNTNHTPQAAAAARALCWLHVKQELLE
jgi:hypothetical protein